ncbi:hypothetical protein DSO57_1022356 [Entomophthora muscae]|uniref:Uncharacterized protein n=1 Tax=Entomophthora muscae TaxID=34485 RepID=A0ACC2SS44_9FUNG|nr:hypothetical protein DSO57_1022356 [Entomophthora muscae]
MSNKPQIAMATILNLGDTIGDDFLLWYLNSNSPTNQSSIFSNSKNISTATNHDKTTRYKLKSIQDSSGPQPTSITLCILDTSKSYSHASETSPLGGNDVSHFALPQNFSSPKCLSPLTIGDDSLFDYQRSPASSRSLAVCVSWDNPVLPRSFSLSTVLGALNLSPASCIEDPMTIFDPDPLGVASPSPLTPSMLSSDFINK